MNISEIIKIIEDWAAPELMDDWDNSGLQYGSGEIELKGVLITLDVTEEVLEFAVKNDLNLIISHHPLIFEGIKDLSLDTHQGRMTYKIIKEDISIYCSHTTLDLAAGGVSDVLADILDILDTKPLVNSVDITSGTPVGYGRIGRIEPVGIDKFSQMVKERLEADVIKVYGKTEDLVRRVAVCGGSGADFIVAAKEAGAQVYITGDIKYHDAQLAVEQGIILMDAGHYYTEKPVLSAIKGKLIDNGADDLNIEIYPDVPFAAKLY